VNVGELDEATDLTEQALGAVISGATVGDVAMAVALLVDAVQHLIEALRGEGES
jgi:hypothetical protein